MVRKAVPVITSHTSENINVSISGCARMSGELYHFYVCTMRHTQQ